MMMLCVLLSATGCDNAPAKGEENSQTTSAATSDDVSSTVSAVQTEQTAEITTTENAIDIIPTENEIHILDIDKRIVHEYRWSDEDATPLVECEYTAIFLGSEDADRYPNLATVLTDIAAAEESRMKSEYAMLSESVDELAAMGLELQEPLASKNNAQVRRADDVVLSVLNDSLYQNGMNGGHRSFWGCNYDTKTGKELYLPDVVTDIKAFEKAVEDELFSTFGADVFYREDIIQEYFEMYGADGTHWTLDYNGVTVYFGDGEITDIGLGNISVTVTFAENADIFNEKYMTVPEAYIVSLPMKSAFYADLDNDGSSEQLTIYDRYDDEYDYYVTLDIYAADTSYTEDLWAYSCEPYYVKADNGRHYLYLFTELETQMYLYVYDITGVMVGKIGEVNVSPHYDDGISAVLTDPERMHFDIFGDGAGGGVPDGNDIFSIGIDGIPAQG